MSEIGFVFWSIVEIAQSPTKLCVSWSNFTKIKFFWSIFFVIPESKCWAFGWGQNLNSFLKNISSKNFLIQTMAFFFIT